MTLTSILTILAILVGPVIAVQLTRFIDERIETKKRKLHIFRTLMATRSYTLNWDHVQALNLIDLEFDKNISSEKKVIEAWKAYLELLGDKAISPDQWSVKRIDLLIELLYEMSQVLKFDFDKTHIKTSSYSPQGHGDDLAKQKQVRDAIIEVFEGRKNLSITVKNVDEVFSPETKKLELP